MLVHHAPVLEAAEAMRSDDIDPSTYVERCLDRADAVEPTIRALVEEADRRERLRRSAADLESRYPDAESRPPLYGVPVGVKDIFHVDGLPTRANSDFPPEELAGPQAEAVTRLLAAGALVFAKTVTTEFAYYEPGPTRNPHDPDHTPGGSSSGSAAAVAAGACPLAIGSQTAGSVVRPAAFCGVVGFKPTFDRIPTDGVLPLAPSLDTVGVFAQDVAGAALAASVLCDDWDDAVDPDGPPTIGVPAEAYLDRASAVGRERFEDHVGALEDSGFDVVRVPALSSIDAVEERHAALMAAEAALAHHERYEAAGDRYSPVLSDLIEDGRDVAVGTLADARAGRRRLRERLGSLVADHGVDVWVAPAAPGPAPVGIDDTGDPVMNAPWTYAGVPAVTVPAGEVDGLPLGLQCVAAHGADERLLAWTEPIAEALRDLG
ncbi:MAG TPA: amidase [Halobacteriales archaeon]|nr:amidase [Halobacteriales archaeon]